jgi:hypothetical protein
MLAEAGGVLCGRGWVFESRLRYVGCLINTRRALLAMILALLLVGCSSESGRGAHLTLHVHGPVSRGSREDCVFFLRAAVQGGGNQDTCLSSIEGFPGPNAKMHSRGLMTFTLRRGIVVLRVRVTQRFAADGAHARQTLRGVIVRGRGEFVGARGSITGGGSIVDTRQTIRVIRLEYRLTYERDR